MKAEERHLRQRKTKEEFTNMVLIVLRYYWHYYDIISTKIGIYCAYLLRNIFP
ncbi:hypothetical protein LguiA_036626 [Lonicera macranthoides]